MTELFDRNRHLFVYFSREQALQAAKSFPTTLGVHIGAGIPATRTTPEVLSLTVANDKAKVLAGLLGHPVEVLPMGTTFSILQDEVSDIGVDRNVCYVTQIHVAANEVDAWVIRGATYEPFVNPLSDHFWPQ